MRLDKNIVVENARIGFRNFSGKKGEYNPQGRRNFCLFFDSELGETLKEDGWNIKWLQPKDEYDEEVPYLQVEVSYDNFPPRVVLVTSGGKTLLDEETISMLDWAEIENVDIIVRPYNWEVSGKTGVKAYVKSMYITVVEDEFAHKYRDVPDSAMSSMVNDVD